MLLVVANREAVATYLKILQIKKNWLCGDRAIPEHKVVLHVQPLRIMRTSMAAAHALALNGC